jgi:hypothetical protein
MNSSDSSQIPAQLALFALLAAAFLYMPFIALMLVCVFAAWSSDRRLRGVFLLAACLLFCILNTTKQIDGDFLNYVRVQSYLEGRPLFTLLNPGELIPITPTYRATEFSFYGAQWLLAQCFDSPSASLSIAITLAIYLPTFAAILMLGRVKGWNNRLTLIVALIAFFGAINFNNTTHLARQYISGSFGFLALVSLCDGRKLRALAWAIVACSVHNGTAYVVLCFGIMSVLFPYGRPFWSRPWGSAFRLLCAVGVLGGSCAALWFHELTGLLENSDITIWRYLLTTSLFAVFWYFCLAHRMDRSDYYLSIAFLVAILISGFFFAMRLQVMALRYFVYLEWLYAPMLASILCAIPRKHVVAYLTSRWLVCCAALCIFVLHMYSSAWQYGPDTTRVLGISVREIMEYIGT